MSFDEQGSRVKLANMNWLKPELFLMPPALIDSHWELDTCAGGVRREFGSN